ncbi:uncharacterized protein [Littorina saxatilis]|uniref:GPR158/179 extracellular domain-containing protein n=1 Tax=Littorina saxatilis TaxID=31220 RepID=A0AAN9C0T2_9CAEN
MRYVGVLMGVGILACWLGVLEGQGKFSWMWYDHFDEIDDHMRTVNADNCQSKSREELVLRADTVSQLPVYNQLLNRIWYPNRTALIHLHNMALNRAFFYSYILQKMNDSQSFYIQPNWLYMYMSAAADVNANPYGINGSAFYFDKDCHYPNWYETVPFNNTLPLFGPKAWRHDDYQDQDNYLREPTRQAVMVADLGAGRGMNYTHSQFKMNPWYTKWLPDLRGDLDSLMKFTYNIGIKYSNVTGKFINDDFVASPFFGPSSPSAQEKDERMLPVMFTQPYFDCGRSNKWIVSAVSPVVDYMPRYSNWTHLRRQRYVGVVVTDTDFIELDFNACGTSAGNPAPSYLSGVHRCQTTTGCKAKIGYGFKRGGYICHCKPGHTYPWNLILPYQGDNIEQSTDTEYREGFKCTPVDFRLVLPKVDNLEGVSIEGGANQLTSGGVRLDTETSNLVSSEFRTRNLRSVNDSVLTFRPLRHPHRDHSHRSEAPVTLEEGLEVETPDRWRGGGSTFFGPLNKDQAARYRDELWMPVRPKTAVPHGVHADTQASHDRKPITMGQIEAAIRRKQQAAGRRRVDTWRKLSNKTDPTFSRRKKRAAVFDQQAFNRMMRIFRHKEAVTSKTCHTMAPHNLIMAGDVAYGAKKQFEPEARTGLRLSHFLSNFLQNTDAAENFGNLRGGGRLHEEHMFGEVIANVMGNFKIYSAAVYFDRYSWETQDGTKRELFGPWAYKKEGSFYVIDTAGMPTRYVDEEWFQAVKGRWATNFQGLKTYKMRPMIRSDPNGTSSIRHEYFPMRYKAPTYQAGYWTRPHFRCDGKVDAWVMTYLSPFFGLDTFKRKLVFRGMTAIDVPLSLLELNQCPMGFGVANAFKNTARCNQFSTWCRPQMGFSFMRGAYRCDCRQGFEYHHLDGKFWIEGSLVELEWEKKSRGYFSRYDELKCRIAGASAVSSTFPVLLLGVLMALATVL